MAKTAQDYPVTFGYKQPYPWGGVHYGEDRAMQVGVPVVVNGKKIARSGNTGFSTGAHLHTEKWVTVARNWWRGRIRFKPTDAFKIKRGARVIFVGEAQGYGKCVVLKRKTTFFDRRRVIYLYAHLNSIGVSVNDWV